MNVLFQVLATLGVPALVSGVVILVVTRKMNRADKRNDYRKRETVLLLRGLLTIGGLASATAIAYRDNHVNGEMADALDNYNEYREDLSAFLVEQTSQKTD